MIPGSFSATFTFTNRCPFTVWPGILTSQGKPLYPTTGFELATGATQSSEAPANWEGRFWARTGCNGQFTCDTGNCGAALECNGAGGAPPVTLGEIRLNGDAGKDFYDISNVDGFNIPLSITPSDGGCTSISCSADINLVCPDDLSVKGPGGNTIACKSACLAFNQPQDCCTGAFNSPDTCQPTDRSRIFKNACPQAYSYAFDDPTSLFTCANGANYAITFCPN
ncbi:Thaumatin-like protein [Thalictrum thalictroides]|uniref:Thaumatin-like protein n=1 Tax=Thalictrum thalictroides TaxID=46969 RepID=A0A7J6V4Q6_THATH|nr:Thaumatin-like protein [Thalictrum thalictroides]